MRSWSRRRLDSQTNPIPRGWRCGACQRPYHGLAPPCIVPPVAGPQSERTNSLGGQLVDRRFPLEECLSDGWPRLNLGSSLPCCRCRSRPTPAPRACQTDLDAALLAGTGTALDVQREPASGAHRERALDGRLCGRPDRSGGRRRHRKGGATPRSAKTSPPPKVVSAILLGFLVNPVR